MLDVFLRREDQRNLELERERDLQRRIAEIHAALQQTHEFEACREVNSMRQASLSALLNLGRR